MTDTDTWSLIHAERATMADTLATLTPEQWAAASLCGGWTVRIAAAHIVAGAEQTPPNFVTRMAASGFRFNRMIDRAARTLGRVEPAELIARLRARTSTTNRPPAPVAAMLGEIVVHGADIRQPLGLPNDVAPAAVRACLEMYRTASFPVGGRKRISGLALAADDLDWSCGAGPQVRGPAMSLLLAMTGRQPGLAGLSGDGLATLAARLA